jgi:hypothetical protein
VNILIFAARICATQRMSSGLDSNSRTRRRCLIHDLSEVIDANDEAARAAQLTAQIRARAPPPAVYGQTFIIGLLTASRQVLVAASQRPNLPALADAERLIPFLSDIQFQRTLKRPALCGLPLGRGCSAFEDAVGAVMLALQADPGGVLNPGLPRARAACELARQFDDLAELQPSAAQLRQYGEELGAALTAVAVGAADKQGQLTGIRQADSRS